MSIGSIQGLGSMRGMGEPPKAKPLTTEQKTQLQDILAPYDSSTITSEDAKDIFKALREAGIRGPEVREAVQNAGFDADGLFKMAHGDMPMQGSKSQASQQMNMEALQSLQSILSQFDLTDISATDQEDLMSQLGQAGLMQSGSVLNLSA
jgi:hypothetical protein